MKKIVLSLFIFFCMCFKACALEITDGIEYLNQNQIDNAIEFFENFVNNKPNDPDGHYWLGLSYKKAKEEKLSKYHLQRSFELTQLLDNVEFQEPIDVKNQEDYLEIAQMYLESQDYNNAHNYTDMALKLNPQNAKGHYMRARIYYLEGDNEESKFAIKRAIQEDSSLLDSQLADIFNIKEVPPYDIEYYNSSAITSFYAGNLEEAIASFKKALDLNFKSINVLNNISSVYIKLLDYENAKRYLKKALFFDKKNFNSYLNLAKISMLESQNTELTKSKRTKFQNEAKSYLKKAVKININEKRAYLELGNIALVQKEYEDAIKYYNTALIFDEKYYEAYLGLAMCHIELGDENSAILALRNAGVLNKQNDEIAYYLAKMCVLKNRMNEAKNYLLQATLKSNNPEYLLELGKIYYYENDIKKAKNSFIKASNHDVRGKFSAELNNFMGLCYYKEKDIKKALMHVKYAIEKDPENVIYYYNLSLIYKSTNQDDLYKKTHRKITGFNPQSVQDYMDLSSIYFDMEQYDISLGILNNGISQIPNSRVLYLTKIKLQEQAGDTQGAKATKDEMNSVFK